MGPHLLQQFPPLLGGKRCGQVLLGGGQNALQADDEEYAAECVRCAMREEEYAKV